MTFAEKAIAFNENLVYTGRPLPQGINILNPFRQSEQALSISKQFYQTFYSDEKTRHIILGINPGRLGAGQTGIAFTDPKRLESECGINFDGNVTHEPSSVFIYEMIKAYGGVQAFYQNFYINSPCPLGFTSTGANGKEKNYNYYDSKDLAGTVRGFMIESLRKLVAIGIRTDVCFCLGTGKNEKFISKLNEEHNFFKKIIALEHPRFIMQYKSTQKQFYINKYLTAFESVS